MYFTLSDILWQLREEEKIHEILIIDLACGSINDLREDRTNGKLIPALSPRITRRIVRYPYGGKSKNKKKYKKRQLKTRKYKIYK